MCELATIHKKYTKLTNIESEKLGRRQNFLIKANLNYICYRNGNHYLLNVSSLPNTLNNRISFQIEMGEERLFTVKQIVWAKVPDYPWWPARIVKGLAQRSRSIYRVHFFGDPTYCYLQSQRLLDFESGLALLPEEHSIDLILKKPIQLAKAAYKKSKSEQCATDIQQQCFHEIQPSITDSFQQTKLQSKPVIENLEKPQHSQQMQAQTIIQKSLIWSQISDITTQNVIDTISSQAFRQLKTSKGYNNRKQALEIQIKLKHILLAKYNLHEIGKHHQCEPQKQNVFRIHRRKLILKEKKNRKNKNKNLFDQVAKRLYKVVKHHFITTTNETQHSVSRIMQNFNNNTADKKYVAKTYCKIAKYMKSGKEKGVGIQQIVQGIEQQIFGRKYTHFDYSYGMEEDLKKEDEQKSKVTQIEAEAH